MMHLPALIRDLALILGVGAIMAIWFHRLRQPSVLGYLAAGMLVGPSIHFFPTVLDRANVQVWADLGVIFLLFVLGLEFSFRRLFQIGRTSIVAAIIEVPAMIIIGLGIGEMIGWEPLDALFLGGIIAISSTTIILKAFEELEIKTQSF